MSLFDNSPNNVSVKGAKNHRVSPQITQREPLYLSLFKNFILSNRVNSQMFYYHFMTVVVIDREICVILDRIQMTAICGIRILLIFYCIGLVLDNVFSYLCL